jgi:hypothetical protein
MADGHGRAGLDAHLVQYNRTAKNLFFKSRRHPNEVQARRLQCRRILSIEQSREANGGPSNSQISSLKKQPSKITCGRKDQPKKIAPFGLYLKPIVRMR